MQVWLLHIGEQLPVDGLVRKHRYGYLARALSDRGHHVLRWAPTFCHYGKTQRYASDRHVEIDSRYTIQFIHSPAYSRNVGLERLRTYRILGRRLRQLVAAESRPDAIVAAIPSLEWADVAVDYGRAHRVPVVIDVRDLWPDVFLNALPSGARPIGRAFLKPYYRMARRACSGAAALAAVSPSYLDWARRAAQRPLQNNDFVAPLGFEPEPMAPLARQKQVAWLETLGIDRRRPICLFAGSLERSYDLETVIDAARCLKSAGRNDVQFVLCGDGSRMALLKRQAAGMANVFLPGWCDAAQLQGITSISVIGLCAYSRDALQSLPNKPFEYLAGRLAILSSLPGDLADLLDRHRCGLTYRAGDATSLAQAIMELVSDSRRLSEMRTNAHQAWEKHYRCASVYSGFVCQLERLASAAAKAA